MHISISRRYARDAKNHLKNYIHKWLRSTALIISLLLNYIMIRPGKISRDTRRGHCNIQYLDVLASYVIQLSEFSYYLTIKG